MLKYIGDFDKLKEFGFHKNRDINYLKFLIDTELKIDVIEIDIKTRKVSRTVKEYLTPEVNCKKIAKYIDDLIQAGLVVKE